MPTTLLNDDGTASMATMIMTSHHGFRRDVACFARAVAAIAAGDRSRARAVSEEWKRFRDALHGHHTVEDTAVFPGMRAAHPELGEAIDRLDGHHRAIDPVLERGDRAFAELRDAADAGAVVGELARLLEEHLEAEEAAIIPHLRDAKEFPPMPEEALAVYADGFAWSTSGLAAPVIAQVNAMLPAGLVAHLPAARATFDARCREVWGHVHTGRSRTSVP
ncbi:MAG TPA: hemerythrin domain-containing protein [Kofleriaceae bacterium]|nr:hemerythrin domain-containing protein [Kofleriaceae bacterium]